MTLRTMMLAAGVLICFAAGAQSGSSDPFVVVCPVEGLIDDSVLILVQRAVHEAKDAEAIVFVVDTYGGRVDSANEITNAIVGAPCPTIAYAKGKGAISAGAIISFSCKDIILAPTAIIGASQPVIPSSEGMLPTGEKEVSALRAMIASLAEHNGHNPHLARAMVDKDVELVAYPRPDGTYDVVASGSLEDPSDERRARREPDPIGDMIDSFADELPEALAEPVRDAGKEFVREIVREIQEGQEGGATQGESEEEYEPGIRDDGGIVVLESGKLLTLTAQEALDYRLIKVIADDVDDALKECGLGGLRKVAIVATWSESLYAFLINPMVAGILLMLGVGGLYFEVKTPGFGLPGTIALIAFALFFGARAVVGLSEWIDLLLIAIGIALILVEIFVLPGFGIAGVAGIVFLFAGIYMSFTFTDFTIPTYSWEFDRLRDAGKTVTIALISLVLMVAVLWKVLPRTPLHGMMVLLHEQDASEGYTVQTEQDSAMAVGLRGTATSMLRPAGRGRFGGKTYQVVSRSEYIEKGVPIVIVQVDGNRYVVDRDDAGTKENA